MTFLFGEVRGKGWIRHSPRPCETQSSRGNRQGCYCSDKAQCCNKTCSRRVWTHRRAGKMQVFPMIWGLGLCFVLALRVSFWANLGRFGGRVLQRRMFWDPIYVLSWSRRRKDLSISIVALLNLYNTLKTFMLHMAVY